MLWNLNLYVLLCVVSATIVSAQDIKVTIPLNRTTINKDKKLFDGFYTLTRSSVLKVNFIAKRYDLDYIIFQVHSHLYNITLYQNKELENSTIQGTNLGLLSNNTAIDQFFVKNTHKDVDLTLYLAVHGYFKADPIPGGCNMEFPVPISPFMTAIYNRDYIYVDVAPAGYDAICQESDEQHVKLEFYMLYLPQQNYEPDVYFAAIKSMTSLKYILENGRLIPKSYWITRRMVSTYVGTGAVYVAVASVVDKYTPYKSYSVYVPVSSYGCEPQADNCDLFKDPFSKLICACVFFIGIFICYFGHRFFKTQTFMIGFLSGLIVTYILVSLILNLDKPAKLAVAVISGVFVGAARVVYWWIYGLPVFSIILSAADVGFLFASLLFYVLPDDWARDTYLNINFNFWTIFIVVVTLVTIVLLSVNVVANLICCSVIGSYATILPIDYYLGSNMKYILVYIERRATVPHYNKAVKMSGFQKNDWVLAFLWLGLAVSGFIYQYYQNKGRPPFPPPPRSIRAVPETSFFAGPSGYRHLDKSLDKQVDHAQSLPYQRQDTERTALLASNKLPLIYQRM